MALLLALRLVCRNFAGVVAAKEFSKPPFCFSTQLVRRLSPWPHYCHDDWADARSKRDLDVVFCVLVFFKHADEHPGNKLRS